VCADLRSSAWGDQIGARLGALQLNSAPGGRSSRRGRRDGERRRGGGRLRFVGSSCFSLPLLSRLVLLGLDLFLRGDYWAGGWMLNW
jgi:hypothetical protein